MGGLASGLAAGRRLGGVGDGGEADEGLAGLGDGLGLDQLIAKGGEGAELGEAGLSPVGVGPGGELVECDLGVFADVEDREGAVEKGSEEKGLLLGMEGWGRGRRQSHLPNPLPRGAGEGARRVGERGGVDQVGDAALHGACPLLPPLLSGGGGEEQGGMGVCPRCCARARMSGKESSPPRALRETARRFHHGEHGVTRSGGRADAGHRGATPRRGGVVVAGTGQALRAEPDDWHAAPGAPGAGGVGPWDGMWR